MVRKRLFCILNISGITLIQVPYWWNKKRDSLAATIHDKRPDLLYSKGPNIPQIEPLPKSRESASFKKIFMTSTEWNEASMDPKGWLMTEKFDGMRLYWTGSQFFTRQGNIMKVPEFFSSQLPKIALDGELW
jgi:ATP-dependent DNA ligase